MTETTATQTNPSGTRRPLVPKRIYFDMDGVLADFDRGVAELAGFEKHHGQGECPAEDDLMWEAIRGVDHFYARLEPIEGAIELFRDLYARYGNRCEILTGIPTPRRHIDAAGEDKVAWCRRLLPDDVKVNIVYRRDKKNFCEGADCLLIDDFSSNIVAWEGHGGTGIMFEGVAETRSKLHAIGVL